MRVFVDTSAWVALADTSDSQHTEARTLWEHLLSSNAELVTTNYVAVETIAVLQRRLGMQAVNRALPSIASVHIEWVDEPLHSAGMQLFITQNRRELSLVDCVSFECCAAKGFSLRFASMPTSASSAFAN